MDDYSGGERPYQRVDGSNWSQEELERGKLIKIKGFPKEHKVKLFRVVVHSRRTEWIVTNDLLPRDSVHEAQKARGVRWKIEICRTHYPHKPRDVRLHAA